MGQKEKWNKFIHGHNYTTPPNPERLEEPPLCECGCGGKVSWINGRGWNRFIGKHGSKHKSNIIKEQKTNEEQGRVGKAPLCRCGCGEKVKWGQGGKWNDYSRGHNNKGNKHSEDHKKKISESEKGKVVSSKTRSKLSKSLKGRKLSEETRARMKGRVWSEETRKKRRDWWKNIKASDKYEDYIKKIFRRRVPSSLEERFIEIIEKNNLPYKFVGNGDFILCGKNPDFINSNGDKIAIEVYSRYYKKKNFKDIEKWKEERSGLFAKFGWETIYFNETEVKENIILERLGKRI